MEGTPAADLFEPTPRTAMVEMIASNRRPEVLELLMRAYYEPLAAYLSATTFRSLGDPRDVVRGFFADRLSREQWLEDWRASDLRLRRWLMNGLLFFCKEERRREHRGSGDGSAEAPPNLDGESPERVFERTYARVTVQRAIESAADLCGQEGYSAHWEFFRRHHLEGDSLVDLAERSGRTVGQVTGMVRTAASRFRRVLAESLVRDGASPEALEAEIASMLATLGSR